MEDTVNDRIILNQGEYQNGYKPIEITKDFYALIGETFKDNGYKYRKTYRILTKTIGKFTIELGFQNASHNDRGYLL